MYDTIAEESIRNRPSFKFEFEVLCCNSCVSSIDCQIFHIVLY